MHLNQASLFEEIVPTPPGFWYRPDFLSHEEEAELLDWFTDLPLSHAYLGEYLSRRRVMGFGWGYDFRTHTLVPGPPLPPFLRPLQRKVAKWLDIPAERVVEALITEYPRGTGIGWHRDNEAFEHIVGISLAGSCRMRLRPLSRRFRLRRRLTADTTALVLPPRSAYLMQGESRWEFQHSVSPVPALRYSITLRTLPRSVRTSEILHKERRRGGRMN